MLDVWRRKLGNLTALSAFISTCWVIRGEMTSVARLVKGQHPYTGAGGPAAVPAPLQENTDKITQISKVTSAFYEQLLMSGFLLWATRRRHSNRLGSNTSQRNNAKKGSVSSYMVGLPRLCADAWQILDGPTPLRLTRGCGQGHTGEVTRSQWGLPGEAGVSLNQSSCGRLTRPQMECPY